MVCDINGLELTKGDVVAPVSGDMKGKVCGVRTEDGEGFVCVRAAHRPYSKGVWYAAEHVQRLAIGKVRPRSNAETEGETTAATNGKAAHNGNGKVSHSNGDARKTRTAAKASTNGKANTSSAKSSSSRKSTAGRSKRRTVTTS